MRVLVKGREEKQSVLWKLREDGEITYKRVPFVNYLYVYEEQAEEALFVVKRNVKKSVRVRDNNGEEFRKLYLNDNTKRYYVKRDLEQHDIPVFEGDITAPKRFLIDNPDVPVNQHGLKYVFMDIETFDLNPFDKDKRGSVIAHDPILSIACKDEDGEVFFVRNTGIDGSAFDTYRKAYRKYVKLRANKTVENREQRKKLKTYIDKQQAVVLSTLRKHEKALLEEYRDYIIDYDVVLAFNGLRFDYPYLKQRFELHGLDYDDLWVVDYDYMECYKKNTWTPLKSYALQSIALHEFEDAVDDPDTPFEHLDEVTKIDWKEATGCMKMFELFLLEPELLKEYNIQDVHLMYLIEEKLNLLKIQEVCASLSHCLFIDTLHNSRMCDMLMLNEYKKLGSIRPSKPSYDVYERRKDPLRGQFPGGGFTYAYMRGFHENVECFDFKSQYPTSAITYNISPETFVSETYPDLTTVFSETEIKLIDYATGPGREKYLNKKGLLKKKTYEKAVKKKQEELGLESSMQDLMWKFVREYEPTDIAKIAKTKNWTFTPADINYDTRGWAVHPHRFYRREEGVLSRIYRRLLEKRDEVKKEMKSCDDDNKRLAFDLEQLAYKILANSIYGFIAMKLGREFMYVIPDSITTCGRFITKKCVEFAKKHGWVSTHGDTDSAFIKNVTGEYTIKELEKKFFDYFNELIEPYNTICEIDLVDPETGKTCTCNHYIVFEHEKTFETCIVCKKKRYYFKTPDGKIKTQGGMMKKTNTVKRAADLQRELVTDVLNKEYDKDVWRDKLMKLKEHVFNHKLELDEIVKVTKLSKPIEDYGQPIIDGKTGKQKLRKRDGKPMFAPIPAHVKVAKQLVEEGIDVEVGDMIEYVVKEHKPRIQPISIKEYKQCNEYDAHYYWERIISGVLEILHAIAVDDIPTHFKGCWNWSDRKIKNMIRKYDIEVEEDE